MKVNVKKEKEYTQLWHQTSITLDKAIKFSRSLPTYNLTDAICRSPYFKNYDVFPPYTYSIWDNHIKSREFLSNKMTHWWYKEINAWQKNPLFPTCIQPVMNASRYICFFPQSNFYSLYQSILNLNIEISVSIKNHQIPEDIDNISLCQKVSF